VPWMTIDTGAKAVAMDVIAVAIGALVRTSVPSSRHGLRLPLSDRPASYLFLKRCLLTVAAYPDTHSAGARLRLPETCGRRPRSHSHTTSAPRQRSAPSLRV
jgi:hypothetical protein